MVNDKRQIMSKKTLSKSLMPAVLQSLTTKSTQSLLHHCIPPLGGVRGRLLLIFLLALISCTETQKEQPMKMNITALTTQGLEGDLQKYQIVNHQHLRSLLQSRPIQVAKTLPSLRGYKPPLPPQ